MVETSLPTSTVRSRYQEGLAGFNVNSASSSAADKLATDYNTFLTMLTTQLQNQDPLQPMDSAQFTQQLVAFSAVEQQIKSNQNLEELLSLQKITGASTLLGYLGKEIEADSNQLELTGETGKFSYQLGNVADTLEITIKDKTGHVVRTINGGSKALNKHDMIWDGKNDAGDAVAKGSYTVSVKAKGDDGKDISVFTTTYGKVTGVESTVEGAVLSIGKMLIPLDKILSIFEPAAVTA